MPCLVMSRNFIITNHCSLCLREEEFVNHLFRFCPWFLSLRHLSSTLVGLGWVQSCFKGYVLLLGKDEWEKVGLLRFGR